MSLLTASWLPEALGKAYRHCVRYLDATANAVGIHKHAITRITT